MSESRFRSVGECGVARGPTVTLGSAFGGLQRPGGRRDRLRLALMRALRPARVPARGDQRYGRGRRRGCGRNGDEHQPRRGIGRTGCGPGSRALAGRPVNDPVAPALPERQPGPARTGPGGAGAARAWAGAGADGAGATTTGRSATRAGGVGPVGGLVGQLDIQRRGRNSRAGFGLPTTIQFPPGSWTRWAVSRDGIMPRLRADSANAGAACASST